MAKTPSAAIVMWKGMRGFGSRNFASNTFLALERPAAACSSLAVRESAAARTSAEARRPEGERRAGCRRLERRLGSRRRLRRSRLREIVGHDLEVGRDVGQLVARQDGLALGFGGSRRGGGLGCRAALGARAPLRFLLGLLGLLQRFEQQAHGARIGRSPGPSGGSSFPGLGLERKSAPGSWLRRLRKSPSMLGSWITVARRKITSSVFVLRSLRFAKRSPMIGMLRMPGMLASVFCTTSCIRPASTPSCPLCRRRIESNSRVSNTGMMFSVPAALSAGFGSEAVETWRRIVGRTFSTTESVLLICGSTAIMKPSAAMLGVVVNCGLMIAVPLPATPTFVLAGIIEK